MRSRYSVASSLRCAGVRTLVDLERGVHHPVGEGAHRVDAASTMPCSFCAVRVVGLQLGQHLHARGLVLLGQRLPSSKSRSFTAVDGLLLRLGGVEVLQLVVQLPGDHLLDALGVPAASRPRGSR